jgi:hypothetical protein
MVMRMRAWRRLREVGAALSVALCLAAGCAVERATAVELVAGGSDAGGGGGAEASIEAGPDDAGDDAPGPSSAESGSDAGASALSCPAATNGIWPSNGQPYGLPDGGYLVYTDEWDVEAGIGPQELFVCSYDAWYVISTQSGDNAAVKTYPNVQMTFEDVPIASFDDLTSTFAETSPHTGVYEDTYDIWLDGIATAGSKQIMIWVDVYGQTPLGSQVATTTLDRHTYDVWNTSDNAHVTFVSSDTQSSGSVNLLDFFSWADGQGWLGSDPKLSQIDFGVEIVSTGGTAARYDFSNFSINFD